MEESAKPANLPLEDGDGQQTPEPAPYHYLPLGAPTNIRVLEILPGYANSEIHFRLQEKRLGAGDIYHAISYAWGPPVFTHKIYSAAGFIQVTENLWEALNRYRKADEMITLWVDAICIDQANNQERSQQIVLMRRIYSESKRVLVWLGLESPSDRLAFQFIRRMVKHARKKGLDGIMADSVDIWAMGCDEDQVAVTDLFAKSWFSRVWTYQEIACAVEATLTKGSLNIKFRHLRIFCLTLVHTAHWSWLKIRAAQCAVLDIALISTTNPLSQQSAETSLFELVEGVRERLATDPRDKIYGLIALASDANPLPFTPTYEIAVNHLYEEFAAHVIRQNKSLDIFRCCTFQPGLRECPSWVPDWRYSENLAATINLRKDSFRAAGASCWDICTAIKNHSLSVDAICLSRLQKVTSPEPAPESLGLKDDESFKPQIKWMQNTIRETMEMTSSSLLYRSEQERWHAWWLTFIGERKNTVDRATPDDEKYVRFWKEWIDGAIQFDDVNGEYESISQWPKVPRSAASMARHRRFYLTQEGCIGWVPLAARTGDIVSLMRGSPVPVLIRPSQQGDSYLMIGQCYINGIMDGEAVAGKEDQFQRIQLV